MKVDNISVPQGDCILSVSYHKRTVSLLRTGKKGETLKNTRKFAGDNRNTKSIEPEFERGWVKNEDISIQTLKVNTHNLSGYISESAIRELDLPTIKPQSAGYKQKKVVPNPKHFAIGMIHDLAYECARNHGFHLISWQLTQIDNGTTITMMGEWNNDKFTFKLMPQ